MAEKAESFKIGKATTLDGRAAAWEELAAAAGGEIAALREAAAHRLHTERKLANRLIVRELFARSDAAAAVEHAPREASHVALAKEETGRRYAENLRELLRLRAQHPVAPPPPPDPALPSTFCKAYDEGWRRVYAAAAADFPKIPEWQRTEVMLPPRS
jgi:hypothetical protein